MMMMMMMMTVVMIMAVTMAMVLSIMTATADGENDSSLVIITVMNLAKNCKADCFTRKAHFLKEHVIRHGLTTFGDSTGFCRGNVTMLIPSLIQLIVSLSLC